MSKIFTPFTLRGLILFFFCLFFLPLTQAYALDVTLGWDKNTETDLAGYKVFYDTESRHPDNPDAYTGTGAAQGASPITIHLGDPGFDPNNPEYTLTFADATKAYFFAVTAFGNGEDGLESTYSNEEATLCISWPEAGLYVNAANDSPYTVRGRANAGAEVELFFGVTSLGTAPTNGERDWEKDVDFEQRFNEGAVPLEVSSEGITAPAVTIIYDMTNPASNATAPPIGGGTLSITWTASDATSGVAWTELWHKCPGGTWSNTGQTQTGTSGTFYYTPTNGDGTYYFATRSVDKAGNWEAQPTGDGDTSINYIASLNSDPTGKDGGGGGCFVTTAAPD